jgi:hypothetical protein
MRNADERSRGVHAAVLAAWYLPRLWHMQPSQLSASFNALSGEMVSEAFSPPRLQSARVLLPGPPGQQNDFELRA